MTARLVADALVRHKPFSLTVRRASKQPLTCSLLFPFGPTHRKPGPRTCGRILRWSMELHTSDILVGRLGLTLVLSCSCYRIEFYTLLKRQIVRMSYATYLPLQYVDGQNTGTFPNAIVYSVPRMGGLYASFLPQPASGHNPSGTERVIAATCGI